MERKIQNFSGRILRQTGPLCSNNCEGFQVPVPLVVPCTLVVNTPPKKHSHQATMPASSIRPPIPDCFCCPILQQTMTDPVLCADGFTYERAAIARWLVQPRGRDPETNQPRPPRSPMTNAALLHVELAPNRALRDAIAAWMVHYPDLEARPGDVDVGADVRLAVEKLQVGVRANRRAEGENKDGLAEKFSESMHTLVASHNGLVRWLKKLDTNFKEINNDLSLFLKVERDRLKEASLKNNHICTNIPEFSQEELRHMYYLAHGIGGRGACMKQISHMDTCIISRMGTCMKQVSRMGTCMKRVSRMGTPCIISRMGTCMKQVSRLGTCMKRVSRVGAADGAGGAGAAVVAEGAAPAAGVREKARKRGRGRAGRAKAGERKEARRGTRDGSGDHPPRE